MRPGFSGAALPVTLLLVLLTGVPAGAQSESTDPWMIEVRADPEIIAADGQSTTTITAEVRTREGGLVPDGTLVRFSTTAGSISTNVLTRGGVARTLLRSAAAEGVAEVTATSGLRAIGRVSITFTAEKMSPEEMKPFVRIEAQSLRYVPEKALIDAAGDVSLTYRTFRLTADLVQLSATTLQLKARSNVRLRSGGQELTAHFLTLDLQQGSGALLTIDEAGKVRRQTFSGHALQVADQQESFAEGTFDLQEIGEPNAAMGARKLALFPGEKLQFSGFVLRLAGSRIIRLPFYVLSLNPYGPDADQYLSFDSVGGLSVNLPLYYSVTDSTNGSLRLRRQSRFSYDGYNTRPGWQLALEQRYRFGQSNRGLLELNQVTTSDWGLRWRHEQQFGRRTHTYISLDSPAHKDLYARSEIYHSMPLGDLTLSTDSSLFDSAPSSHHSRLYFRMRPGRIGRSNIQYYWSGNVAWSYWGRQSTLEEGVDLQIHPPAVPLGRATSLQCYVGGGYTAGSTASGPTAQASAMITRRLGGRASASLRYSYYFSGRTSEFYGATSSQSITGQLFTGGSQRWNSSLTATLMPATGDLSVYGSLSYSPIRDWRLELRPSFSRYGSASWLGVPRSNTNLDVYLARQIGGRDIALRWSTLDRRIRLELATTALRF